MIYIHQVAKADFVVRSRARFDGVKFLCQTSFGECALDGSRPLGALRMAGPGDVLLVMGALDETGCETFAGGGWFHTFL